MSVPHLPLEVWIRIFTHLDPLSLSSLSEVNQAFHKLATDESLFRRYLRQADSEPTHPAQLYRRLEALHYPAETRVSILSSARTELLCVVEDTLVLCDFEKSRLICFPSGVTVDIEESLESDETFLISYPHFLDPEERHVVLPGGHLGFFYSFNETYFAVMDVVTGELVKNPVHGGKVPPKEILNGKYVVAAGNNAEWIAYHISEDKIALVDWQTGELVREIGDIRPNVKYLLGECTGINGSSIVGLIFEDKESPTKEVSARGFDNVEMKFPSDPGKSLYAVLRSADTKTHIIVTSCNIYGPVYHQFIAYRREADDDKQLYGRLPSQSFPELWECGRVILFRYESLSLDQSVEWPLFLDLWVELKDGSPMRETAIPTINYPNLLPVWSRLTFDGGLVVMTGEYEFNVNLFKIINTEQDSTIILLRRWSIKNMISLHVVADHYIVAQNRVGKVIVLHFNWFCDNARGVYACPGLVQDEEEEINELGEGMAA